MLREDVHDHVANLSGPDSPTAANFGANDIGWQALGPAIAVTTLSSVVVAVRWYTRCRIVRCVGGDDYVIILSLALVWAMTAIIAAEVHEGIGNYRGPEHLSDLAKLIVANNDIWAAAVAVTKASILMQYFRIFSGRTTRLLCYILLAVLLPALCWAIFGGTFLCHPIAKLWYPDLPGHCLSAQRYWISVASINIALDFLVFFLPIPAITSLRLARKEKAALVLVFVLGFLVCIVSVIRLATVVSTARMGDYIMSGIWAIIWSSVEANVGIMCASLLALKPLVTKLCPSLMEETELPRHSMRLPMAQTIAWPSDDATWVHPPSVSLPTTPTTTKSKSESFIKRTGTLRMPLQLNGPSDWPLPAQGLTVPDRGVNG